MYWGNASIVLIIYPENKLVVDHAEIDELFLLSTTHVKSGKHINLDQACLKTAIKSLQLVYVVYQKW